MERERDERLHATGFVLQRTRPQHVIDPLFVGLDVAVEHGDVRTHPEAVRQPVDRQVAVGVRLVVADLAADPLGEDLRPAPRQRVEPRLHQFTQHFLVGLAVELREEGDLDRREALQVDIRPDPLEAAQQLQVVVPGQIGMQAVDDVHLRQRLIRPLAQLVPRLLQAHRVGAVVARLQPREGAEETARDADVGRLEADVVVEVGTAAVPPLALAVGEPADREEIGRREQPDAVVQRQPFTGIELVRDPVQANGVQSFPHRLCKPRNCLWDVRRRRPPQPRTESRRDGRRSSCRTARSRSRRRGPGRRREPSSARAASP